MPQRYENVEFSEDGAVGNLKLDRKGFAFLPNGGDETEDLRECKWDKIVEYAACGSSASSTDHKLRLVLRKVSKSKGTEKKKEILLAFESHDDLNKVEKDICGYMRRNSILQDDSLSGSLPFHLDRRSSHNSTSPFDLSFSSTTSAIPVSPSASRRMSNDFLRSSSSLPPVSPFSDTSSHSAALDDQPLPAAEKARYQSVAVGGKEGSLDMSQDGLLFYKKGKTKGRNKPKQIPFSAIQKLQVNTTAPKLKLTFKDEEDAVLFAFSGREDMEEVKKEIESHIHLESKKTDPLRPTSMADPKQSDPPQPSTNDGQIQKADDKESAIAHGLERGQAWRLQREASIEESKDLQERTEDIRSRPEMWSITYEQLLQLAEDVKLKFGKFKYKRATMRDVNRKILEPHCIKTGTSYALSLNPEGLLVDAFITHAWDEKFADFVESIRLCFHSTLVRPTLWICAFALMQGDAQLIEKQLGTATESLEDSPFVQALSKAKMFVIVRNSAIDLYSRIWCICELLHGKKLGLVPGKAFVTGPNDFSDNTTSCLDAKASNPKDRDKILRVLLTEFDREEIDSFVHQFRAFKPVDSKTDDRCKMM